MAPDLDPNSIQDCRLLFVQTFGCVSSICTSSDLRTQNLLLLLLLLLCHLRLHLPAPPPITTAMIVARHIPTETALPCKVFWKTNDLMAAELAVQRLSANSWKRSLGGCFLVVKFTGLKEFVRWAVCENASFEAFPFLDPLKGLRCSSFLDIHYFPLPKTITKQTPKGTTIGWGPQWRWLAMSPCIPDDLPASNKWYPAKKKNYQLRHLGGDTM